MNNALLLERAARLAGGLARLGLIADDHIARFKRPKEYRFVDAPPKNANGKVLKTVLRERL